MASRPEDVCRLCNLLWSFHVEFIRPVAYGALCHFIATPSLVNCPHLFPQLSPASSSSSSGQNYFSLAMNWLMPGRTGKTKCVSSGPDVAERSFQNGMALCPASMSPNGKSGGSGFQAHGQLQFFPCLFKSQLSCRQNAGPVEVHRSALQKRSYCTITCGRPLSSVQLP